MHGSNRSYSTTYNTPSISYRPHAIHSFNKLALSFASKPSSNPIVKPSSQSVFPGQSFTSTHFLVQSKHSIRIFFRMDYCMMEAFSYYPLLSVRFNFCCCILTWQTLVMIKIQHASMKISAHLQREIKFLGRIHSWFSTEIWNSP